jgi:hypothetical protein
MAGSHTEGAASRPKIAYEIASGQDGQPDYRTPTGRSDLRKPGTSSANGGEWTIAAAREPVPIFNRSASVRALYLDFDGAIATDPDWWRTHDYRCACTFKQQRDPETCARGGGFRAIRRNVTTDERAI